MVGAREAMGGVHGRCAWNSRALPNSAAGALAAAMAMVGARACAWWVPVRAHGGCVGAHGGGAMRPGTPPSPLPPRLLLRKPSSRASSERHTHLYERGRTQAITAGAGCRRQGRSRQASSQPSGSDVIQTRLM
jgi:hypothetical protein